MEGERVPNDGHRLLEMATWMFAVLGVLAPVTGAIVRWLTFTISGIHGDTMGLALNCSVVQLTATGLLVMILPIYEIPMMWGWARSGHQTVRLWHTINSQRGTLQHDRKVIEALEGELAKYPNAEQLDLHVWRRLDDSRRELAKIKQRQLELETDIAGVEEKFRPLRNEALEVIFGYLVVGAAVTVVLPGFPYSCFGIVAPFLLIAAIVIPSLGRKKIGLAEALPGVVVTLVLTIVVSSLVGVVPGVDTSVFTFSRQVTGVVNGTYEDLGSTNGLTSLVACSTRNVVAVDVQSSLIEAERAIKAEPTTNPSLWQVLVDGARIAAPGYRGCP